MIDNGGMPQFWLVSPELRIWSSTNMPLSLIEGALGGIGLFLLGMRLMSDGIRTVADARIRDVFTKLTSNRFYSMLFGMATALAVNSGSAAVIFTIGLVNGGVLNIFQALSVLGGVLIGASLPLHIHIIPYSLISTPLIFSGVVLKFFARKRRYANAGDLILGIGLLFLGLTLLEGSYRPFDHHPFYTTFNELFFHQPILATIFGALISFLVQSARSSVTVVASLSSGYQIDPITASRMVSGGLIGVAAMGALASVGGNSVTRRVATTYLFFAFSVALLLVPLASLMLEAAQRLPFVEWSGACSEGQPLFCQLAWVHTVSSLLVACLLIAISAPLARMLGGSSVITGNGAVASQPCAGYLDERILNTPPLAMEQVRKEIIRMMSVTAFMYADIHEILSDFDARRADTIRQHEQVLDSLNHEITTFLAALARTADSPEISYDIPGLFQTVSDLEHVGDRCENILEGIVGKKEAGVVFSEDAMDDLKRLALVVATAISDTEHMIRHGFIRDSFDLAAAKTAARVVFETARQNHFERMSNGVCPPRAAKLFNEMTSDFEGIARLCWNIITCQGRKR
ncbi:Na/Pi cotransporter family protein [Oryzomonas sagensis]|uniref:Na/Pi cotransporter family protein n=2 Tax=Oryzomonas sagensis TaxID=2603857 RepID=A0ABQ6TP03_9BACT|nr:Na/Pi cotransporter family protein [Oryzomonas sagensis]